MLLREMQHACTPVAKLGTYPGRDALQRYLKAHAPDPTGRKKVLLEKEKSASPSISTLRGQWDIKESE